MSRCLLPMVISLPVQSYDDMGWSKNSHCMAARSALLRALESVSYTHLTLPTNREV